MSGLSVSGLTYDYGEKRALDDVAFSVAPGQFCALLGPNGAGKSTLFNLLTRLLVAPTGRIDLAGYDLSRHPRAALAQIGIVFQQTTLDLDLSVRQNLMYFAALHGIAGRIAAGRVDRALDRLDMLARADEKVRALNGGHKRRTELARALLHDPKVLLLDEPTVGLDAASRQAITDHVHDLTEQGISVLWSTHLSDEVRPDDHLVVLHHAKVLAQGACTDIADGLPLSDRFLAMTGQA